MGKCGSGWSDLAGVRGVDPGGATILCTERSSDLTNLIRTNMVQMKEGLEEQKDDKVIESSRV